MCNLHRTEPTLSLTVPLCSRCAPTTCAMRMAHSRANASGAIGLSSVCATPGAPLSTRNPSGMPQTCAESRHTSMRRPGSPVSRRSTEASHKRLNPSSALTVSIRQRAEAFVSTSSGSTPPKCDRGCRRKRRRSAIARPPSGTPRACVPSRQSDRQRRCGSPVCGVQAETRATARPAGSQGIRRVRRLHLEHHARRALVICIRCRLWRCLALHLRWSRHFERRPRVHGERGSDGSRRLGCSAFQDGRYALPVISPSRPHLKSHDGAGIGEGAERWQKGGAKSSARPQEGVQHTPLHLGELAPALLVERKRPQPSLQCTAHITG
mmetsp:Transcript_6154/g.16096  ORF Transcript_6154/g.16096 Transcript_6154/m.16096 type:complete len:323 (-) Transcript_6154:834-1802(-)